MVSRDGKATEVRQILLVEDDDALRGLLQRHLAERGWKVAEARTVGEALAALEARRPDLLVLDLHLPDGSGWEVAACLRSAPGPRVPIVVCSAYSHPIRHSCRIEGYLAKPFTLADLDEAIDKAMTAPQSMDGPPATPRKRDRRKVAFYSSLAHDVRTPMSALRTGIESLLSNDVAWDETARREFLHLIATSAERVIRYARDVVDMARLEAGAMRYDPEPVEPCEAVESALRDLSASGVDTSRVLVQVEPQTAQAYADPVHVLRILVVLLENALRFSTGPVRVQALSSRNRVLWRVSDSGPGVPPKDRRKIFSKCYRMRACPPGTSGGPRLSLYICSQLARLQGGRLWVGESEEGGACFCLALPMVGASRISR